MTEVETIQYVLNQFLNILIYYNSGILLVGYWRGKFPDSCLEVAITSIPIIVIWILLGMKFGVWWP